MRWVIEELLLPRIVVGRVVYVRWVVARVLLMRMAVHLAANLNGLFFFQN